MGRIAAIAAVGLCALAAAGCQKKTQEAATNAQTAQGQTVQGQTGQTASNGTSGPEIASPQRKPGSGR